MGRLNDFSPLLLALEGTGITFLATVLGASAVFFFKKEVSPQWERGFLGFAAGVMIAASVWSLLIPAIEMAEEQGSIGWVPAAGGFVTGGLFLLLLDRLIPHLHPGSRNPEGPKSPLGRSTLLVLAVTLHNIPEGMAVGLSFGLAAQAGSGVTLAAAFALATGIALQNIPEGAAVALPMKREGLSNGKAFLFGAASGLVEPMGGVAAVLVAGTVQPLMPWFLSFAAGAMIYVVVEELIPEAHLGEHSHVGTGGVMLGFLVMMILDVALG
ncbi:ZIP family metal transporter [Papillibacter cinnamivorans]|uniref:ZIP family metal transporter n=1 Tax=Papillibacter cinnamivorans TaxID=100176 RepID=UPI003BFA73CE